MKTLIIDNYDSFTYNLFHLFAEVTGREPVVIKNDHQAWRMEWLHAFDQVVISPGPGHPAIAKDMGISRQVLRQSRIVKPLLGICLGHQGLCYEAGAKVIEAPEPVHGRVDRVRHDNSPLFEGIPETLEVVRYHSLIATDLPDTIKPLAWTEEGILMAVAHAQRPHWGCQFHPESACSQHGAQLIRNFCRLAREHNERANSHARPELAPKVSSDVSFSPAPNTPRRVYRLYARALQARVGTDVAFACLHAQSERAFWLDSNNKSSETSRVSVMGDDSGPCARSVTADVHTRRVEVRHASGQRERLTDQGFFDWLEQDLRAMVLVEDDAPELPFDVRPGWFGHLGYELKAECGGARRHRAKQPDGAMLFADRLLVFDHTQNQLHALALLDAHDPAAEAKAREWADAMDRSLAAALPAEALPQATATGRALQTRHRPAEYLECIEACQQQIKRGESYEICLTNELTFELECEVEPLALYRALRKRNPTSFSAFLRWETWSVLSLSPERFMRIDRQRRAESRPMKGTRKRSSLPAEDASLRQDLAENAKDRAENLMIVDLVRNDLGRCAKLCAVTAGPLFVVETYATVHQLVSTISAELRPGASAVDCVRAAFPGGSMTGAPKVRTMEIIDDLEGGPRGVYSGAIGYFALNGAADFSIVIRTLVMSGPHLSLGCGGAIIALSDARAELEETALKSMALLAPFGLELVLDDAAESEQTASKRRVAPQPLVAEDDVDRDEELAESLRSFLLTEPRRSIEQYLLAGPRVDGAGPDVLPIDVLGVNRGLLIRRGDLRTPDLSAGDPVALLLVNAADRSELRVEGRLESVTPLEADAVFSTLSRTQQLECWAHQLTARSASIPLEAEGLLGLNERYHGQAIARPDIFRVSRLRPERWHVSNGVGVLPSLPTTVGRGPHAAA